MPIRLVFFNKEPKRATRKGTHPKKHTIQEAKPSSKRNYPGLIKGSHPQTGSCVDDSGEIRVWRLRLWRLPCLCQGAAGTLSRHQKTVCARVLYLGNPILMLGFCIVTYTGSGMPQKNKNGGSGGGGGPHLAVLGMVQGAAKRKAVCFHRKGIAAKAVFGSATPPCRRHMCGRNHYFFLFVPRFVTWSHTLHWGGPGLDCLLF